MLGILTLVLALGASWFGYGATRRFVRDRLRYVDAAHAPIAAIIAGVGAAVLFLPLTWLPLIGGGTAVAFGLGVGLGARAGQSDVKHGYRLGSGG